MLKAIGALTILIIFLGLLTGVLNPLELWNAVWHTILSIIQQLKHLFPGTAP